MDNRQPINAPAMECLKHYFAGLPKGREGRKARGAFDEFSRAPNRSILNWVSGTYAPTGEALLRIQFFLEIVGYGVQELKLLKQRNPEVYLLNKLIAFGVINVDELQVAFGYKDRGPVFSLLRQISPIGKAQTRQTAIKVYDENKKTLDKAEEIFRKVWGFTPLAKPVERPAAVTSIAAAPAGAEQLKEVGQIVAPPTFVISTVAALIRSLIPLLELLLSDVFTPEQRKMVRDKTGGDGVFKAANLLNRLCGEKANLQGKNS